MHNQMLFPWDGQAVGLFSKLTYPRDLCLILVPEYENRCYGYKYIYRVGSGGYNFTGFAGLYWERWPPDVCT
jgi:hypothetical protein